MYSYLEVIKDTDKVVVKRINVTGKSERQIGRIRFGISINLDWLNYALRDFSSKKELKLNDNSRRNIKANSRVELCPVQN